MAVIIVIRGARLRIYFIQQVGTVIDVQPAVAVPDAGIYRPIVPRGFQLLFLPYTSPPYPSKSLWVHTTLNVQLLFCRWVDVLRIAPL